MNIQKLNEALAVTAQISPADIGAILADGYKSIICCRPDGEAADQPAFDTLDAAARAEGLDTLYLPVQIDQIEIREFAVAELEADHARILESARRHVGGVGAQRIGSAAVERFVDELFVR